MAGFCKAIVMSILVRTLDGEFQEVEITDETPVSELLLIAGPQTKAPLQVVHVEWRDGHIVKTSILSPQDRVNPYVVDALPPSSVEPSSPDEEDLESDHSTETFGKCRFWIVEKDAQTRIFFNPYIRMVLGLPMWFLDLYPTEHMTVVEMDAFLKICLGLSSKDDRFRLFGQFRSHVSLLEERAWVRHLTMLEDPENDHFWQFMMLPGAEVQDHLGISRQGPLLHRSGFQLSSKKYWFVLQGTTLSYYKSPQDRRWKREIIDVDKCRIVYRGGNGSRTCFKMEIVEAESGKRHSCKSQSKKRIEKWIRALQASHRSCEMLEPIDMKTILRRTCPQPHPSPVPVSVMGLSQTRSPFKPSIEALLPETNPMVAFPDLLAEVETSLKKIELTAEGIARRKKLRRREALLWGEQIRHYLQTVLKLDHIGYADAILPDIKSVVGEMRNFLDLAEGKSEFEPETINVDAMVESIMDGVNCLFIIFRASIEEHGEVCPAGLHDTKEYRENRLSLMKARHALKKSYSKIKIVEGRGTKDVDSTVATPKVYQKAKKPWWNWLQVSKRRAAISDREVNDMSITNTIPETTFQANNEGDEGIKTLKTVDASESIWSKWKFPFGSKASKPLSTGTDAQKENIEPEPLVVKTTRFALKTGSSESEELYEGVDPRLPTSSPYPPLSLRNHHRSLSLRPSGSPAVRGKEGMTMPRGSHHQGERRRSVVEIDQVLLNALLKDARLAKMIQPKDEEEEEKGGEGEGNNGNIRAHTDNSADTFVELPCNICSRMIKGSGELLKTPFENFHKDCLKCHTCGERLAGDSYSMERGKPTCRRISCGARPVSFHASTNQVPLKSILKKST